MPCFAFKISQSMVCSCAPENQIEGLLHAFPREDLEGD